MESSQSEPVTSPVPSIAEPQNRAQRWSGVYSVLASCALATCAFPPLDLGWLAWFAYAPLISAAAAASTPRKAFGLGYLFGWGHWGVSVYWVGSAVVTWTGSPIGWIAWFGLTAILGLWFGLLGWSIRKAQSLASPFRISLVVGLLGMLVEWARGVGPQAMPWTISGYTQYRNLWMVQAADLGGVWLLCFAIWWVNGLAAVAWLRPNVSLQVRKRTALLISLVFILLIGYGAIRSQGWERRGQPYPVIAIQPDRPSGLRSRDQIAQDYSRIDRFASSIQPGEAGLAVWPETITPDDTTQRGMSRGLIEEISMKTQMHHLVGATREDPDATPFNSAVWFRPDGTLGGVYDKHWLVPFGEWIPLRSLIPFGEAFNFIERDNGTGKGDAPFDMSPARPAVMICFESIFPVIARTRTMAGANLLALMTNDSWGGRSSALQQHHAMTVLRAVETRRWLVASATTGITAIVNPTGEYASLAPHTEGVLRREVRLLDEITLYVRWGDWVPVVGAVLQVLTLLIRRRS